MRTEFTKVLETQNIAEPEQPKPVEGCPRTVLGLLCLKGAYECLCGLVTAWESHREGDTLALTLHAPRGLNTEAPIVESLELVPLRIRFLVGHGVVEALIDLARPENAELALALGSRDF